VIDLQTIRKPLLRWTAIGHRVFDDGTELIGRVPHVAPEAWLHKLFPKLDSQIIARYEEVLPGFKGSAFSRFLQLFNGLNLFSTDFYLLGHRSSYKRDGSVFQPWELLTSNGPNRGGIAPPELLIIGGSNVLRKGVTFTENPSGSIWAIDRTRPGLPMFEWPDFETFLYSEIRRLASLFDDEGRPQDQEKLAQYHVVQ
jgi:hypothetical protein